MFPFLLASSPSSKLQNGELRSHPEFVLDVKDNIATTDPSTTTCASLILSGYRSPFEATIVSQLRARAGQLHEKTRLDEFGMGSHTTNSSLAGDHPIYQVSGEHEGGKDVPPELWYSVGGSSGGSALSVAKGTAGVAIGTDTGGSVRLPAAYCGIVGFKPSYGMISRHGVVPYANSLDTVGFLAKDVSRIQRLVVQTGLWKEHDPKDPTSLSPQARQRCSADKQGYQDEAARDGRKELCDLSRVTFGIPVEYNINELEPCVRDAWASAAAALQERGARMVPVSLPSTRHALSAYYVIAPAEASSNLAKYDGIRYGARDRAQTQAGPTQGSAAGNDDAQDGILYARTRGGGFGDEVQRRILLGSYTLSSEAMDNYFIQAQRVRRLVQRDFNRVFKLPNLLHEPETFDLSEMDDQVPLESKLGPVQVDFLLCPTAPSLPPKISQIREQTPLDSYMNDVFTVPASLAGLPAISIPMPVTTAPSDADTPRNAGLQLIGQYWDDARLLAVAEGVSNCLTSRT